MVHASHHSCRENMQFALAKESFVTDSAAVLWCSRYTVESDHWSLANLNFSYDNLNMIYLLNINLRIIKFKLIKLF